MVKTINNYNGWQMAYTFNQGYPILVRGFRLSDREQALAELTLHQNKDYYITRNSYKTIREGYNTSNLLGLHQIVIDIDYHNLSGKQAQELSELLYKEILNYKELPLSSINYSGRGLHLYIEFKQFSYVLEWLYRLVANELADRYSTALNEIIEAYNLEGIVSLDRKTISPAGLIRLTESFNTKSNTQVKTLWQSDNRYLINDLAKKYKLVDVIVNPLKPLVLSYSAIRLAKYRAELILNLPKAEIGNRNNYIFILYNNLNIYKPKQEAQRIVREYNKSLKQPLKESQIKAIIKTLDKKHYRYKNKTFYDLLDIEPRVSKTAIRNAKSIKFNKERTKRNNEIVRQLKETLKTHKEIAESLNISRGTVKDVARKHKITHQLRKELNK